MNTSTCPFIENFTDELTTIEPTPLTHDVQSHIRRDADARAQVAQLGGGHLGSLPGGLPVEFKLEKLRRSNGAIRGPLNGRVVTNVDRDNSELPLRNSALANANLRREIGLRASTDLDSSLDGIVDDRRIDGVFHGASHVGTEPNISAATNVKQRSSSNFQQRRFLHGNSEANSVASMPTTDYKKARPTRADLKAAKRLKDIWRAIPRQERPTQEDLAERFPGGGSQSLVSQYLNGIIPLNVSAVVFFANEFRCKPEDIYPDLPALDEVTKLYRNSSKHLQAVTEVTTDMIRIPRFDTRASMGIGLPAPEFETLVGTLMASREWFRNELRHVSSADDLAVLTGYGDSMEGTFSDGAQLIVDRGITDVKVDAVYVLALNDELYVKRLQRRPDGTILMISDNKKYEPYVIGNPERERFTVLGRVVGVWNFAKL